MIQSNELKPCPCCGSSASFITRLEVYEDGFPVRESSSFLVRCDDEKCGVQTETWYVNDVAEVWNRRVKYE